MISRATATDILIIMAILVWVYVVSVTVYTGYQDNINFS